VAIQILGGRGRGFALKSPPEQITRPTSVLLKRRLFDWRQSWDEFNFIDLCAGSGAMGLEALSRGAKNIWFNELNRNAFKVLEKNIELWKTKHGLEESQQLWTTQLDFRKILKNLQAHDTAWSANSVLFFDPPYESHELYLEFWEQIKGFPGEIWVESDEQKGLSLAVQRKYLGQITKEVMQGQHWMLVGKL
jgi:16S rRNA (guanine966-N2)-methyltransferase